jgi:hypothetical protein
MLVNNKAIVEALYGGDGVKVRYIDGTVEETNDPERMRQISQQLESQVKATNNILLG